MHHEKNSIRTHTDLRQLNSITQKRTKMHQRVKLNDKKKCLTVFISAFEIAHDTQTKVDNHCDYESHANR